MAMKPELEDQDIDLMPRESKVVPKSPPVREPQPVPSKKGEVVLLHYDREIDVYNLAFDETQPRIIQAQRKNLPDEHTSCVHK